MAAKKKSEFLMYKDRPLVRKGNTIYYGNLSDDFVLVLQILSTKESNGVQLADRVMVQLLKNDENLRPNERIVHKIEKKGLYSAMHIGCIWLERALTA
ncbi:MAG: hypothetical protein NC122_00565 [Faecalibacterium sp.]|nr:hypothetical protein [Ruminococcus sp.]MCM1392805.1 hypothetical protein [Ruminococcus sp.]MCM1484681.1 hypothetical protein [Faecalibacterium sp.]